VTSTRPDFQFYGRRKGKPLRRHHVGLMDGLLPGITVELAEPLANTGTRRWLEIGFGGGEHLVHQAALNPDVSVIGAEAFLNGVAKALAHVEEKAVSNVRVFYGDARALLAALPDQSFERVYLLYPDPWPKQKQKTRRFVSQQNLQHFHRILAPQGQFLFASDIPDYCEWTRREVKSFANFAPLQDSGEAFDNWTTTRYEAKALREGRTPHYMRFVKV
jgi:tRNA (guanine-N7-)-methyltransferase